MVCLTLGQPSVPENQPRSALEVSSYPLCEREPSVRIHVVKGKNQGTIVNFQVST